MRRISNHSTGICQGDVVLFTDYEVDGEMWTGDGPRQVRSHVGFSEPFTETPAVHVSLSMWDVSSAANSRMDVKAEDVDERGFAIVFRTWADTKVARVRVNWMAIGAVRHEDAWDLQV